MISHKMFNKFIAMVDRYYLCDTVHDNRVGGVYFAIDYEAHTHVYISRWHNGIIYFRYVNNDYILTSLVKNYRDYNGLTKIIKTLF